MVVSSFDDATLAPQSPWYCSIFTISIRFQKMCASTNKMNTKHGQKAPSVSVFLFNVKHKLAIILWNTSIYTRMIDTIFVRTFMTLLTPGLFLLCHHEVESFGSEWNFLPTIRWIVMKFGTHIPVPWVVIIYAFCLVPPKFSLIQYLASAKLLFPSASAVTNFVFQAI